eukprot:15366668-Ditylum_brightwellii.AAC.1
MSKAKQFNKKDWISKRYPATELTLLMHEHSMMLEWGPDQIFWLNFLAMILLASILGDFAEKLAAHTNQCASQYDWFHLSNLLLVIDGCFFFGGIEHKDQSFNSMAATANISLLALGCMALILPAPFAEYYDAEEERIKTYAFLFADEDEEMTSLPFWVSMAGL